MKLRKSFAIVIVALFIIIGINAYMIFWQLPEPELTPPELTKLPEFIPGLEGFAKTEVSTEPGIIYLTSGCLVLKIITTEIQTSSIQTGLEHEVPFRPTTHDIIRDALEGFNISVLSVRITKMIDGTYFAQMLLKQGDRIINLDSRPSDAIGVAVRTGTGIWVTQDLLDNHAERVC